MAPDRTALTAGLSGLALAAVSGLVRALVVAVLKAHGASLTWAIVVFGGVSPIGSCWECWPSGRPSRHGCATTR